MWGIVPAAGSGTRIQPLAFSKELLPVGSRQDGGTERPRAVSEYLLERLIRGGASKICFVIAPGKSDILEYYGGSGVGGVSLAFVVQPQPAGLCDAVFHAIPLVPADESVVIGLPDTVWFPEDALCSLPDNTLGMLLFPVEHPRFFDAVVTAENNRVVEIQVKRNDASSHWIWGALKMPGAVFHELHSLWQERERCDEFLGTLINAWLERGGHAVGVHSGTTYVDVGTLHGYREAVRMLSEANDGTIPVLVKPVPENPCLR
jgi:glucose-1-phosphate thymidylyltransferase